MNDSASLNILLTDDDPDDCQFFKEALEELSMGALLKTVHDGEQLMVHLEKVSPNLPDAIFLDLNMPRKNGFECLTEIKNNSTLKNLPVIIFSTSYNEEIAEKLFKTGATYYISKPSNFEELKNVVHKALMLLSVNQCKPTIENFYINNLKPCCNGRNNR